jgi:hypothetical protein
VEERRSAAAALTEISGAFDANCPFFLEAGVTSEAKQGLTRKKKRTNSFFNPFIAKFKAQ